MILFGKRLGINKSLLDGVKYYAGLVLNTLMILLRFQINGDKKLAFVENEGKRRA